jgi:hypothetical protein
MAEALGGVRHTPACHLAPGRVHVGNRCPTGDMSCFATRLRWSQKPGAPFLKSVAPVSTDFSWTAALLMSSTPFAYPQVVSRTFASFRVARFSVSAVQRDF